jgi:hypothetical protein
MGVVASAFKGLTALPGVIGDSLSPEGFKQEFGGLATEQGLKNYGSLLGKSALFGLSLGGAIAGTLAGGVGGLVAIPGVISSGIALGGSFKDLIESRSLTSDWDKTEKEVMSSDAGQVLNGISKVSAFVGGLGSIPKDIQNIVNIANRGLTRTSIGEIAKILAPAVKHSVAAGNSAAVAGNTISAMLSLNEARQTTDSIPPTEIRPRGASRIGLSRQQLSQAAQGLIPPGSLIRGQPILPPSYNPFNVQRNPLPPIK